MKYYHATPRKLKVGTILIPAYKKHTKWTTSLYCDRYIYITVDIVPHYTICLQAYKNNWNIYEVVPIDKPQRGMWDDLICRRAEITKFIGNARGIINRRISSMNPRDKILEIESFDEERDEYIIDGEPTCIDVYKLLDKKQHNRSEKSALFSFFWKIGSKTQSNFKKQYWNYPN